MKRAALLIAAALFMLPLAAQTPERTGGVYFAYQAPENASYHQAPEGYEAFYISHYGRHGSRWMTSQSRYDRLVSYFKDKRNLTPAGKKAAAAMKKVAKDAKGHAGDLTALGARQHRDIAARMFRNFPQVFGTGSEVQAASSTSRRCIASMEAFTGQLKKERPALRIR
ncbi:MAG: histidine-type phosphatase, partial [Bacteroidales bacterium]|nr:histidine-type phosphatase [Bacteroidales bacterium]